ncbi:hypothetical protein [Sulfurovum riftiae]|uniref:hypothetical protein n=1 Tax=Sulfurovum riftiae TaxID=1630136 RepID=UPI003B982980
MNIQKTSIAPMITMTCNTPMIVRVSLGSVFVSSIFLLWAIWSASSENPCTTPILYLSSLVFLSFAAITSIVASITSPLS